MMQRIRSALGKVRDQKGFTLVEMALVLIIIGIIIGAIVKGKDLVRGAEQKRIYSKFLSGWRLAYLNFYDRTGQILGDQHNGTGEGQDGQADTEDTGAAPDNPGRAELVTGDTDGTVNYLGLNNAGLNPPPTNTGNAYTYNYVNSAGNTNVLTIAFDWASGVGANYNFMEIQNIPSELAMAIDTMIDGQANGNGGDFLNGAGGAWSTTATDTSTARWKMQF